MVTASDAMSVNFPATPWVPRIGEMRSDPPLKDVGSKGAAGDVGSTAFSAFWRDDVEEADSLVLEVFDFHFPLL